MTINEDLNLAIDIPPTLKQNTSRPLRCNLASPFPLRWVRWRAMTRPAPGLTTLKALRRPGDGIEARSEPPTRGT
jgi:hypothetical protein